MGNYPAKEYIGAIAQRAMGFKETQISTRAFLLRRREALDTEKQYLVSLALGVVEYKNSYEALKTILMECFSQHRLLSVEEGESCYKAMMETTNEIEDAQASEEIKAISTGALQKDILALEFSHRFLHARNDLFKAFVMQAFLSPNCESEFLPLLDGNKFEFIDYVEKNLDETVYYMLDYIEFKV